MKLIYLLHVSKKSLDLKTCKYVTEFWKITLMGMPETIRNFELTTILLTSQKYILSISTLFLVIQSIFTLLEQ